MYQHVWQLVRTWAGSFSMYVIQLINMNGKYLTSNLFGGHILLKSEIQEKVVVFVVVEDKTLIIKKK